MMRKAPSHGSNLVISFALSGIVHLLFLSTLPIEGLADGDRTRNTHALQVDLRAGTPLQAGLDAAPLTGEPPLVTRLGDADPELPIQHAPSTKNSHSPPSPDWNPHPSDGVRLRITAGIPHWDPSRYLPAAALDTPARPENPFTLDLSETKSFPSERAIFRLFINASGWVDGIEQLSPDTSTLLSDLLEQKLLTAHFQPAIRKGAPVGSIKHMAFGLETAESPSLSHGAQ